ncbi:acyl carrier protein [Geofilum rubicundum]|nr:acyl carrier protein [Geofilum rubicundum]
MATTISEIEQNISAFIVQNSHADTTLMNAETLLFKEGIFDSMGFVQLVDFLESTFGISIDDTEFVEENFESLRAISHYVQKKMTMKMA